MAKPSDNINLPPKVATDRYRKRIKEEDLNRGEANYAKSAIAGSLAGLAAKLKGRSRGQRAALGAAVGIAAQAAVRQAGASTKDFYGERSRTAKKSEKLPIVAGLTAAGILARKRYRGLSRKFRALVEFAISAGLKRKLIHGGALAGGIAIADSATHAAFPDKDKSRKDAAAKGLKQGAVYGSVLATVEPHLVSKFRRYLARVESGLIEFKVNHDEDLRAQRRRLAVLGGGVLAGAVGLGLLARSGNKSRVVADLGHAARKMPVGRGTLARTAQANALRSERGYVHLKPMAPGQRKRFDRLPAATQTRAGEIAAHNANPNFSPEERRRARKMLGEFRGQHNFSAFIKDVALKSLPKETRENILKLVQAKPGTLFTHYGMVAKELMAKADPHNLKTARMNVGKMSRKKAADEVYARKEKKHVLVLNDRIVDGHHLLAKAERGGHTGSLHVVDLTPARFQLSRFEFARGDQFSKMLKRVSGPVYSLPARGGGASGGYAQILKRVAAKLKKLATKPTQFSFENGEIRRVLDKLEKLRKKAPARQLGKELSYDEAERRLVERMRPAKLPPQREFAYLAGAATPQMIVLRKSREQEQREAREHRLRVAAGAAGLGAGVALGAAKLSKFGGRARVALKVVKGAYKTGKVRGIMGERYGFERNLSDERIAILFKRQQLREKEGDRFADPLYAASTGQHVYAHTEGGERRSYGGDNAPLPLAHAQVLRAAYHKAGRLRTVGGRAIAAASDVGDVIQGRPRKVDYAGRPKKREWEKPYAKRVAETAVLGAGVLGGALLLKKNPRLRAKVLGAAGKVREKVNRSIPDFFASRKFPAPVQELAARFIAFDDLANWAGWDVRDPRGRSARVFAPGSRKRMRRDKEWHETAEGQRKIRNALIAATAVAAGGAGLLAGRRFPKKAVQAASSKIIRMPVTA